MEKEYFKLILDDAIRTNKMTMFYVLFVSLISYDNNRTKSEIRENCKTIDILIDALGEYPDNKELQEHRDKLIEYNKMYKPLGG